MQNLSTNQQIEALQAAQKSMSERMQALAGENLRLKRSIRRYARWGMMFVVVACASALSYAWAIDPLTESAGTPNSGEVRTGFANGQVISAAEFNTNFKSLVSKTNELVTEVNALNARAPTRDNVYLVTQVDTIAPNTIGNVTVQCSDVNDVLLSGSCRGVDTFTIPWSGSPQLSNQSVEASFSCSFGHNNPAETVDRQIQAYAICLAVP